MAHEVHEHFFIGGPRSRWAGQPQGKLVHSHEGGDRPHQHPDTGPASYTIDKEEWLRTTGLFGGGRKTFTKAPTGEQLPLAELEDWQKSFEVIVGDPAMGSQFKEHHGPGLALPMRMALGFKMQVSNVTPFDPKRRRA